MIKRSKSLTALLDKVVNIPVIQITILVILFILVSMFSLSAQTPRKDSGAEGPKKIIPLAIGDQIPDELWDMPLHFINPTGENKTKTLRDYQHKELLILDFWNTWCKTCIKLFPKIDSLNNAFNKDVRIVPVSDDPSSKVIPWMKEKEIALRSTHVLNDNDSSGVAAYFPKRILPHIVIIENNKVKAITFPQYITGPNLQKMIQGKDLLMKMKYDKQDFNPRLPLFIENLNAEENNFISRSLWSPRLDGVPSLYLQSHDTLRNRTIVKMVNTLFKFAWGAVYPNVSLFSKNQLIYPSENQSLMDSIFTYELVFPTDQKDKIRPKIKADLESYFGWTADTVSNIITTVRFRPIDENEHIDERDYTFKLPVKLGLKRMSLKGLIFSINMERDRGVFAMPSTKDIVFKETQDMSFNSLREINRWLRKYGIRGIIEQNNVQQLVFRKL